MNNEELVQDGLHLAVEIYMHTILWTDKLGWCPMDLVGSRLLLQLVVL